jgi:hypothetical protein
MLLYAAALPYQTKRLMFDGPIHSLYMSLHIDAVFRAS